MSGKLFTVFLLLSLGNFASADLAPGQLGIKCQQSSTETLPVSIIANLSGGSNVYHCSVPGANDRCNMSGISRIAVGAPYNIVATISTPLAANFFGMDNIVAQPTNVTNSLQGATIVINLLKSSGSITFQDAKQVRLDCSRAF